MYNVFIDTRNKNKDKDVKDFGVKFRERTTELS